MQRQVDKVAATLLLESTKVVLELLGRWSIEGGHGAQKPGGLSQTYASIRRLRDYLQRAISAYPTRVALDLSEQDAGLLASCAVHYMGDLEVNARAPGATSRQRELADGKVRTLADLAVEMAHGRIARIPVPGGRPHDPPAVTEVLTTIARRAAEVGRRAEEAHTGLGHFETGPGAGGNRPEWSGPPGTPSPDRPRPAAGPEPALQTAPMPGAAPAAPTPSSHGAPAYRSAEDAGEAQLLDPRRLRDPRLRAMIAMDQGAYGRSKAAKHFRLAMVHLSSILEGVIVDYAIPRRRDLGIIGSPETWKIADLVTAILGDRLTIKDRPCLVQLIAGRNLVRPAIQLTNPLAVTAESLAQNEAFVRRVLAELGFAGAAEPGAGDAPV